MEYYGLQGLSVAVLHSSVRGVHVYRRMPATGTKLLLRIDQASKYRNAIGVYELNGGMVGHVGAEHCNLIARWMKYSDYKVCTVGLPICTQKFQINVRLQVSTFANPARSYYARYVYSFWLFFLPGLYIMCHSTYLVGKCRHIPK